MQTAGSELPTGTVTFLMTDIERSTELVRRLGEGWPAVLGEQRRLVREAAFGAGGHEVDARGEELFFVFRRAADALVAAAAAQRAVSEHVWPAEALVRVRIGVHTGEPALGDDGGYLGIDVHRTARICAAGHGGQVLVSETTRPLAGEAELRFLDLGEQRFKGFEREERIFQLVAPGLVEQFPPLVAPSAIPFEGRERGLAVIAQERVAAGRPRLPARFRLRPPVPRRVADLSWKVRSLEGQVPDERRRELAELARALVVLSRAARDSDRYLSRVDREALARRLAQTRELGVRSRYAQRATGAMADQLALLEELTSARATLDTRTDELERRVANVGTAEIASLRGEVESLTQSLEGALQRALDAVGPVAVRLHRTRYRGIYRQGDLWAVPYEDSQGVDRVRRFDDLAEARQFRTTVRLEHKNARVAEAMEAARPIGAGGPGAGGIGMGGGAGAGDGGGGGGGSV